ncbi:AP2/ERF domain [Macleaya cordata]|uniref:AP2/ERF domain n=1 Tax=Macleaya cordata TaxID=56857 RepID=A0A200R8I4_MACCD|nr:AP2/ERF domain [Macleaya cordata]
MDSSQNWLAFSLSNPPHDHHHHYQQTSSDHHYFETFNTTSSHSREDDNNGTTTVGGTEGGCSGADLSMFNFGPKLEDFLGVCGTTTTSTTSPLCQFSGENNHQSDHTTGIYDDSELKSIAASFLRGYSTMTDHHNIPTTTTHDHTENLNAAAAVVAPVVTSPVSKKAVDNFGQRTSIYRGVTRHRWTGRYEAHLWDNSCRREGQSRKGRQGGYDKEDKAARAYDLAALKYWGPTTTTNFPVTNYEKEIEEMKNMSRQEFVASLRRKSSGFSRGASIYRGVTRHHQHGRWQARIGRVAGNKDLYLGTFSTQEEAAEAYDIAAIKFRGLNAVTNFDMSRYDVKSIANSNLPIGGITGKTRANSESISDNRSNDGSRSDDRDFSSISSTTLSFGIPIKQDPSDHYWSSLVESQNNNSATTNAFLQHHQPASLLTNGSAMELSSSTRSYDPNHQSNMNMFFNGGFVHHQQEQEQQQQCTSSIPFGSNNNNMMSYSSNPSYGSWVTPSPAHVFQTGKPNLSVFQTPIFGME